MEPKKPRLTLKSFLHFHFLMKRLFLKEISIHLVMLSFLVMSVSPNILDRVLIAHYFPVPRWKGEWKFQEKIMERERIIAITMERRVSLNKG